MADTMMERLSNYFGGDPDADRGPFLDPGPLGGMEDFKQSFRNMVAMNDPEALREFIRASMGDMMTIAQDDPAFAAEFYKAANMFPETMEMLPPSLRTPDLWNMLTVVMLISQEPWAMVGMFKAKDLVWTWQRKKM